MTTDAPELIYIVWINPQLYYLCQTHDQVLEKLQLLADDPTLTMAQVFSVAMIVNLSHYRQKNLVG